MSCVRSPSPIVPIGGYTGSWFVLEAEPTGDGGYFSRRSIPASGGFTMQPFSHAPPLGRLCRASRVHFRGSYFTPTIIRRQRLPQGLTSFTAKVVEVLTHF